MSPDRVAQCAQLAMLFELSSSPKPGNVDRCHDFSDIGFHHFLVSSVSAYPVFRKAAQGKGSVGSLILEVYRPGRNGIFAAILTLARWCSCSPWPVLQGSICMRSAFMTIWHGFCREPLCRMQSIFTKPSKSLGPGSQMSKSSA